MKKDLDKLSDNSIFLLRQWGKLTPESKKKYPDGLVSILDEAAQIETKKASNEPWQRYVNSEGDIYIDENNWKKTIEKTKYANELIESKEIPLNYGVIKIKMTTYLQSREELSKDIFTRPSQRNVWNEVYKYLKTGNKTHSIVSGNPGIGKSRSMAYFLRLLLKDRKYVVYESKLDEKAFIFVPQEDKSYKVWECLNFIRGSCAILQNPDAYHLIDSDKGITYVSEGGAAHIVVSASPRVTEKLKDFKNHPGTRVFFMPVWKYEELNALKQEISVNGKFLTSERFNFLYDQFGGRIRYIFAPKNDLDIINLKTAIRKLPFEKLKSIIDQPVIEGENDPETGSSMIFVYEENPNSNEEYKYMMDIPNYIVNLGSKTIIEGLVSKYWNELKDFLNPTGIQYKKNPILCGHIFEVLGKIKIEYGGE